MLRNEWSRKPPAGRAAFALLTVTLLGPQAAFGYVGPGAGLSAIGSLLALLAAIVMMIVGFFWYPIKRLLGRTRQGARPEVTESRGTPGDGQTTGEQQGKPMSD